MLQDYIGRKYCVLLTCIPKVLMSILFIFVKDVWVLILGRAIIGIADYFLLTIVPVYASEISDVRSFVKLIICLWNYKSICRYIKFYWHCHFCYPMSYFLFTNVVLNFNALTILYQLIMFLYRNTCVELSAHFFKYFPQSVVSWQCRLARLSHIPHLV